MSVQDNANEKCVCLVIKGGRLTGRTLAIAMRMYLAANKRVTTAPPKRGKQTLKELSADGSTRENFQIGTEYIRSFERIAKKHEVDYAIVRDSCEKEQKHLVYFKSKDAKDMDAAFREFSAKQLCKSATKPTLRETLSQMMQKAREQKAEQTKEQNREREAVL